MVFRRSLIGAFGAFGAGLFALTIPLASFAQSASPSPSSSPVPKSSSSPVRAALFAYEAPLTGLHASGAPAPSASPSYTSDQQFFLTVPEDVPGDLAELFLEDNGFTVDSRNGQNYVIHAAGNNPNIAMLIDAGYMLAVKDNEIEMTRVPNDPDYRSQWANRNTGQSYSNSTQTWTGVAGFDMRAEQAWDITTGSDQIVVGVIDSGVDYNHPDLRDNMWRNTRESLGDANGDGCPGTCNTDDDGDGLIDEDSSGCQASGFRQSGSACTTLRDTAADDDENGYNDDIFGINAIIGTSPASNGNPLDDNSHGTHVAGSIAGRGDNGIGIAGMAWNARIMAIKILNASGSGSTASAVAGIEYAIAQKNLFDRGQGGANIRVLNNSWGGMLSAGATCAANYAQLRDAIQRANAAGILFVAAAGNSNMNNDQVEFVPANCAPEIETVAAVDNRGGLACFATPYAATCTGTSGSNFGAARVDIGAPGQFILSTYPTQMNASDPYKIYSGTSMAAPAVSGLAALMAGANQQLTPAEISAIMALRVRPLASLNGRVATNGMIDAAASVREVTRRMGDLDNNRCVGLRDLSLLQSSFGQTVAANTGADLNGDGTVNRGDMAIMSSNFGRCVR